jgi:hypothetical protein
MSQLAPYVGRTVDYSIIQNMTPTQLGLVGANGQGYVLTGILKLAQRFLLLLLTRLGSSQYFPNAGSTFMLDAARGGWRTVADIGQSFQMSLPGIVQQLDAIATAQDPSDELYANAQLTDVVLDQNVATVTVLLTSQAGESYALIAPISTLPG